ncbi:hypothetical protein JXJ21_03170 [candidate division KSB1 bacterium]|nr:hypothetical protein [candidate division KSB1 bacterium]
MNAKQEYRNRELVNNACESILNIIQPGDVITQVGTHRWWQLADLFVHKAIQWYQRKLLGSDANWKDTHTMLYFDKMNTFSVELPRATLKPLQEYCLSNLSIYRLHQVELTTEYIETLRQTALDLVGENYDLGQALDIAINFIMGYDHQRRLKIFDLGRKKKVCSVGVRVAFEHLYQARIKTKDSPSGKWLFDSLNPEKWSAKAIDKFDGTDVEATAPAHFANSNLFSREFELVARFNGGKQIFP